MRTPLSSLFLVGGLHLVPPRGWCCYVVDMTEALPPVEPVPAPTKKCCCCEEPAKPQPKQPKEKPGRPINNCCPAFDKLKPDGSVRIAPDSAGLSAAGFPPLPLFRTRGLQPACHNLLGSFRALP